MIVPLETAEFVFDTHPPLQRPSPQLSAALKFTAKRYRRTGSQLHTPSYTRSRDSYGLTLLLIHGAGHHKEQWEPAIQAIYRHYSDEAVAKWAKIREVWAFDWQDHGDAALLNRDALNARGDKGVAQHELGTALTTFVHSKHVKGHTMVAISHSLGSVGLLLATKNLMSVGKPFQSVIIVDPVVLTRELYNKDADYQTTSDFLVKGTISRRDNWSSKASAHAWFRKRFPWTEWDPRILRIFVEHGLEQTEDGVRLKCNKKHETFSYHPSEDIFESAQAVSQICKTLPVHVIWGETPDLTTEDMRASLSDVSQGRVLSSVRVVPDTSHLVLQQKPDALAQFICEILDESVFFEPHSRL